MKTILGKTRRRFLFSKCSRTGMIPVSLWLASLLALLMLSTATYYAVGQVHRLEHSTRVLLKAGVPLKESAHNTGDRHAKTEFLLHKALALGDPSYFSAIEQTIEKQKSILANLRPLLTDASEARQAMKPIIMPDLKDK